jgi:arylsulfatase A-like enzyme
MAWLVITTLVFAGLEVSADRPNVLLIMTDDQGYGDMSCHGNKVLKTPHLDALHAQSARLTDFHVDPTCSPTRAALLTGRYSSRTGVWHTIAGRSILRRDETTLADHFRKAGYRTGIFGKWHLGERYPYRPQDRGFTVSLVHGGGGIGQTPDAWGNRYFDDRLWLNGVLKAHKGYCTDVFVQAAEAFIRESKEPFFCYLATNVPHSPYLAPEASIAPFVKAGVPQPRAAFYGMLANFDENLGNLIATLKKTGKENNTLVIFLTDNGTAAGWNEAKKEGYNAGMRGTKGSVYEGGHRVPCFLRWPGQIKPGDIPGLTAHFDLMPTLLDLCQIEVKHRLPLDGISLRPTLEGKAPVPERTLIVHSQRIEIPEKGRQFAVMTPRWRFLNTKELFDLHTDPGQTTNVAPKNPKIVAQMQMEYDKWWKSISSRFHEHVPLVIGSPEENPTEITAHDWRGNQVPWDQSMIRKMPAVNSTWAIEVARAGNYRFTLRHAPPEAKIPLRATRARVRLGDKEAIAEVTPGSLAVDVVLRLPAGSSRLQTWLENKTESRGAFYLDVRLEE